MLPDTTNKMLLPTPAGDICLHYDNKKKALIVTLPPELKIGIVGNVDLKVTGDYNVETLGEINLLSRRKDINIESLGARIFLNSFRAKQIRQLGRYKAKRKEYLDKAKIKIPQKNIFEEVIEAMSSLNERVTALEGIGNNPDFKLPSIVCGCQKDNPEEGRETKVPLPKD